MDFNSPVGERPIAEDEIESELIEAHRTILLNESRLTLMKDLLGRGLCTRDIYSFACSQADLCVTFVDPDQSTVKSAMKMKIRDLIQTIKIEHRRRRKKEKELLVQFGGRSWKIRKKIKTIKQSLQQEREKILLKYKNKIDHYVKSMERLGGKKSENRTVGIDGMNKVPSVGGAVVHGTVGMDGMNKVPPVGGGSSTRTCWYGWNE